MPLRWYGAIRPMFKRNRWHIVRDDLVYVRQGPDKGQTGKVLEVWRNKRMPQVIVEGKNLRKKKVYTGNNSELEDAAASTDSQDKDNYLVVTMEAPIPYSAVSLVDPKTALPVKIAWRYTTDGTLVRVSKGRNSSGSLIPFPQDSLLVKKTLVGEKDTPKEAAMRSTYNPATGFPFTLASLEKFAGVRFYSMWCSGLHR